MDLVVKKFVDYLEQDIKKLEYEVKLKALTRRKPQLLPEDEFYFDKIAERDHVKRIISVPRDEWGHHAEIFNNFDYFSEFLMASPLETKEKMYLIFCMFEKNLKTGLLRENIRFFNAKAIKDYDFKYLTKEEAKKMIHTDAYAKLFFKEESELTEDEILKLGELEEFAAKYPSKEERIVELHKKINEHYFSKKDSFTMEDIKNIIAILKEFKVNEKLCAKIQALLEKEVRKRNLPVFNSESISKNISVKSKESKINDKEYLLLKRELGKYFNIDTNEVVQPLNLELQIFCVNLLIRMGFSEDKIREILRIINKNNLKLYDEPSIMFEQILKKLEYYENIPEIMGVIDTLKDIFKELLTENMEEREFWMQEFNSELNSALQLIPKTYEYEISEGKKLAKTYC